MTRHNLKELTESYNNDSIKALKGAERVRKKPGVIFGSSNIDGAFHTFKEILGNSLDEARGGFGTDIDVTYHVDGAITIRDYGRGVPMGWNEREGRYNWDLVFNELYAGGKYSEEDGTKSDAYKYSLGTNGLGSASVQYVSEYFIVHSYQGDKVYKKEFKGGYPLDNELIEETLETPEYGTYIKWKIDNKVFKDTNFKIKMFTEYCEGQAHINAINLHLTYEKTGEVFDYKGKGITHYLKELSGENLIELCEKKVKDSGVTDGVHYSTECEVALAITKEMKSNQLFFHNTSTLNRGRSIEATQDAISGFFKQLGKDNKVTIMPYDYNDYLSIIVSSYSNVAEFEAQTKEGVSDKFIYDIVFKTVKDLLEEEVAKGKESMKTLMTSVLTTALARKKAKELENQEKMVLKTTSKKTKAEKYVDCKSNNPKEKELFIVEGE